MVNGPTDSATGEGAAGAGLAGVGETIAGVCSSALRITQATTACVAAYQVVLARSSAVRLERGSAG